MKITGNFKLQDSLKFFDTRPTWVGTRSNMVGWEPY